MNISQLIADHRISGALVKLAVRNRETQQYFKFDADFYTTWPKNKILWDFMMILICGWMLENRKNWQR